MTEYQPSEIRISDAEREDALGKLGEHMGAGRLDIDEYGERTAMVATAKTRGQLLRLFDDLPEPKPVFGQPRPLAPAPRERGFVERYAPVAVPVAAIVIIGATFIAFGVTFFLPLLFIFLFVNRKGGGWHGGGPARPRGYPHRSS